MQIILYTANGTIQFDVSVDCSKEEIAKALSEDTCTFTTTEGSYIIVNPADAIVTEVRDISDVAISDDITPPVSE